MNKVILLSLTILLSLFTTTKSFAGKTVTVEITTSHKTVKEALMATKSELMKEKFVPNGGIGESGFTATRTTGSHSDYYTADVMAEQIEGKVKVTITFIKSGSGMLKLQKVADEIKSNLEGGNSTGSINNTENKSVVINNSNITTTKIGSSSLDCTKYLKTKNISNKILIGSGISVGLGFVLSVAIGSSATSRTLTTLGIVGAGTGLVVNLISKSNIKKNRCALNLQFKPNSIGLAYNF